MLLAILLTRNRVLIVIGGVIVAGIFSFNAHGGLKPLSPSSWSGDVVLVSDPVTFPGRLVVDVDTSQGRMQMTASGAASRPLRGATAGTVLEVRGRTRALKNPERLASRHIRMSLMATEVSRVNTTALWRLPVDAVRSTVLRGSEVLPEDQQPVYAGFVIGDDRGSDPRVTKAFEDAGLSHLLVVSGQNVVFVMAVFSPALARLGRRSRSISLVAILLLFAAVTRFEPSVLRATTMAMFAILGAGAGRKLNGRVRLALAVAVLVLIDPLLISSFGFRLSVAATAGIALFAHPIASRLRGPVIVRQVLSVTIAAQLAVAPFIVPVFGPMPLAALPANVLAEPVAGLVMMWGSSVGIVAGTLGGWPALVLQLPAMIGVWWIMQVAEFSSNLPLPHLGLIEMAVVAALTTGGIWSGSLWRIRRQSLRSNEVSG
ncbi:MAG: ComEC/Rec2 family competence protein [Acidimicrobiales bacterium]